MEQVVIPENMPKPFMLLAPNHFQHSYLHWHVPVSNLTPLLILHASDSVSPSTTKAFWWMYNSLTKFRSLQSTPRPTSAKTAINQHLFVCNTIRKKQKKSQSCTTYRPRALKYGRQRCRGKTKSFRLVNETLQFAENLAKLIKLSTVLWHPTPVHISWWLYCRKI